jgi:hypothetical protein
MSEANYVRTYFTTKMLQRTLFLDPGFRGDHLLLNYYTPMMLKQLN